MLRGASKYGAIAATDECSAFALWFKAPVDERYTRLVSTVTLAAATLDLPHSYRLFELDRKLTARRPREPHWYLAAVATEPQLRGRGLGTAVVSFGLRKADKEQLKAYLETAEPGVVDYYSTLGFEVWDTFPLHDGPTVWCMGREPRLYDRLPS